jgi:predicted metal-binding membrane protein
MTFISMFFSMPLLVWGASGLLRNYAQASLTDRVRDSAALVIGMVMLVAGLFQVIVAARSAL